MFASLTAARRRLALGAGAMLTVGALALPAGALAYDGGISVTPTTTVEGNEGTTDVSTKVDLKCPTNVSRCDYSFSWESGTATEGEDFDGIPTGGTPFLGPGGHKSQDVAVSVRGDTKREPDETYSITVTRTEYEGSSPVRSIGPLTYTAGTIVDDDTPICTDCATGTLPAGPDPICTVCDTGTLPTGPGGGDSTPPPADPGADPAICTVCDIGTLPTEPGGRDSTPAPAADASPN